jgi:hypothetical protein
MTAGAEPWRSRDTRTCAWTRATKSGSACQAARDLVNNVPGPKTVKNRVHLDVYTRDLADPEGNEFCAFTA